MSLDRPRRASLSSSTPRPRTPRPLQNRPSFFGWLGLIAKLPGIALVLVSACASGQVFDSSDEDLESTDTTTPPAQVTASVPHSSGADNSGDEDTTTKFLVVEVIAEHPHDPAAFTQGLLLDEDRLLESTGLYGESDVREVDLESGRVEQIADVDDSLFAEGLALTDEELVQLSWKKGVALRRDPDTFDIIGQHTYEGEGWGLCYDGTQLVMSDGSATLTRRDPVTFEAKGTVEVTRDDGSAVFQLNELECVDGRVWANVWQTDEIVGIDADSGRVEVSVDASGLLGETERRTADVLNGIATEDGETWLVTGKLWPSLFEVAFVPAG